jgi:hypothetical protein
MESVGQGDIVPIVNRHEIDLQFDNVEMIGSELLEGKSAGVASVVIDVVRGARDFA